MPKRGRPRTAEWTRQECACGCGTVFETPSWDPRKYVSREHYWAAKKGQPQPHLRRRETKVCPTCGKTFEVGGLAGKRAQIYCSTKCAGTSKYPPPKRLSETDAAYLAGFFDGEGNLQQLKPGVWRAKIYQTDEKVIRWIAEVTGTGFVGKQIPTGSNLIKQSNFRTAWYWQLYGHNAALFIYLIRPYMRVKIERAELMLADYDFKLDDVLPYDSNYDSEKQVHIAWE